MKPICKHLKSKYKQDVKTFTHLKAFIPSPMCVLGSMVLNFRAQISEKYRLKIFCKIVMLLSNVIENEKDRAHIAAYLNTY